MRLRSGPAAPNRRRLALWQRRRGTDYATARSRVLYERSRTLDSISQKIGDMAIMTDAIAAGDGVPADGTRDGVEYRLRNVVVDGMRQ